jgi:hypothetical protein
VGDGQLVELAPTDPAGRDDVPFDPRPQPEDRALLLRALVLLQECQPLVGEVGHRDRLRAHVDAGVLLALEPAQLAATALRDGPVIFFRSRLPFGPTPRSTEAIQRSTVTPLPGRASSLR